MAGGVGGSASTLGSLKVSARALEAPKATYGDLLGGLGLPKLKANEDRKFRNILA